MTAYRLSVAPMMGWTDRHARYFMRQLSRHALLYTEMVTTGAILHGDRDRHLAFSDEEHPVAVQLGGSDPAELAECARIAEQYGYDEVNLNIGCPSERVQSGAFGACLMAEPELVAACVDAMIEAVEVPVTVKCRIGIDDMEDYEAFRAFIDVVASAGCDNFIVHARKAWLKGLSPKENREIPPLHYDYVYRLKQERSDLDIVINGGIKTMEQIEQHLLEVDAVMLGREAYQNPWLLASVDTRLHDETSAMISRDQVIERMMEYAEREISKGARLHDISRHIHGLYNGVSGARAWRRKLSTEAHAEGASAELLRFDRR